MLFYIWFALFLENETTDQINKFLEKNKNFKILNIYENKIYLKYHKLIKNNYMHTLPTVNKWL